MKVTKRDKILVDVEKVFCDDIGLFALFKNHNLEFRHVSLTNKVPWKRFIFESLGLTFLHLLIKKHIEIEVVDFEEQHLFKLFKTRHRAFEIKPTKTGTRTNDILSNHLLSLIEQKPQNSHNANFLNHIIFSLFDNYIGYREKYLKPEKEFFLKNLNQYVDELDWLSIEEEFHSFGPLFKYTINIEPIYIPRLKIQHSEVYEVHKNLLQSLLFYKRFIERLEAVLDYNYNIRRSFNGHTSKRGNWDFPIPNL